MFVILGGLEIVLWGIELLYGPIPAPVWAAICIMYSVPGVKLVRLNINVDTFTVTLFTVLLLGRG